jgi:hypothetical protein
LAPNKSKNLPEETYETASRLQPESVADRADILFKDKETNHWFRIPVTFLIGNKAMTQEEIDLEFKRAEEIRNGMTRISNRMSRRASFNGL